MLVYCVELKRTKEEANSIFQFAVSYLAYSSSRYAVNVCQTAIQFCSIKHDKAIHLILYCTQPKTTATTNDII